MKKPCLVLAILFSSLLSLNAQTDQTCNFAGTKTFGQFVGQSNHIGPDVIFLCHNDSIQVLHNGDAILTGDPQPATPAGIAYAFYVCPPTVTGDNLQAISASPGPGDPCVLNTPPTSLGLYFTRAVPNGEYTVFVNNGAYIDVFGQGQPLELYFAPITVDHISNNGGYESPVVGASPGPCVNVNTDEAFSIVYLNEVTKRNVSTQFGDDCLGKFVFEGGYPEYDNTATFTFDIFLKSDPTVKALNYIPNAFSYHLSPIIFSVTTPGIYTISAEDGISCGLQFDMDMSGCDASDNLNLAIDSVSGTPGSIICVPVRGRNFDIISGSLSFNWDPTKLNYEYLDNLHPSIASFFNPITFLNTGAIGIGQLGMVLLDDIGFSPISIPDDEVLFEICFKLLDSIPNCTSIDVSANPAQIGFEDPFGAPLAFSYTAGTVCATTPVATTAPIKRHGNIQPNPVNAGDDCLLLTWANTVTTARLSMCNTHGALLMEKQIMLQGGENFLKLGTERLAPGVYFIEIASAKERNSFKLVVY